jgi:short-subunit dehydrogenase
MPAMPARFRKRRWSAALVTGASSGIGATMARHLAESGTDLVLVARRRDRLEALATELRSAGRDVEVIVADLADPGDLARVETRLADDQRPVELLVNNAGFGTRGPFASLPVEEEEQELRVNVLAPVRLARAVLPGMLRQRRGGIINVSSIAGLQPIPYWATYAATKAYLTNFSLSVHEEVKSSGVTVLALMPGFTTTEFLRSENLGLQVVPGALWMSADDVCTAALTAIRRGRATCVPGIRYKLLAGAMRLAPWSITRRLGRAGTERVS